MPKNHRVAKIVIGTCKTCRNEFILTPAQKWQLKMKPNKNTFCSADCYSEFKKGSGNPKWRGGRTTTDGYVYIYMPNHPYAVKKGVCLRTQIDYGKTYWQVLETRGKYSPHRRKHT